MPRGFSPWPTPWTPKPCVGLTPPQRAILPLDRVNIPRSLRRLIEKKPFEIKVDTAFDRVIEACAATPYRPDTWINAEIIEIFKTFHRAGLAHSVECWQGETLAGGLYGLAIGGAFCGESMFSRVSGASKIALVHLCHRLRSGGFTLLDCQILNPHTAQFGAYDIPQADYLRQLGMAIRENGGFLNKNLIIY